MKYSLSCLVLAAALAGCSESHSGTDDAAIIIDLDGAMLDGGPPDGGPPNVGAACSFDVPCMGSADMCLSDPAFLPNGYCTQACDPGMSGSCPDGSVCVQVSMTQSICLDSCDPSATGECRAGYGCAHGGMGIPNVCIGGCSTDADCTDPLRCDPDGGDLGAGSCFDPGAALGDACVDDAACPMGATCLTEAFNGWPAGSCIDLGGCDVATDTGCSAGAHCVAGGFMGGICVQGCAMDVDCRLAYECRAPAAYPTRTVCQPACTMDIQCTDGRVCNPGLGTCNVAFDAAQLGQTCSRFGGGCDGGACLSERQNGYPNAYCAYQGCTVGMDSTCPTGGVCAPTADGVGLCLHGCAMDADCRAAEGYACRPVDYTGGSTSTACLPACTMDSQCTRMGNVCNPGTGRCGPAFAGTVGAMCDAMGGCAGGRCQLDADGWPNGTCTAPGCRLSGTGPEFVCPTGSACADDMTGDPTLGFCLQACVVGAAGGCRTDGYECVTLGGTDPMAGVCRPMPPPTP